MWKYGFVIILTLTLLPIRDARGDDSSADSPQSQNEALAPTIDQINPCGTELTPEQMAFELERQAAGYPSFTRPSAQTLYCPIAVHIVRSSNSTGGLTLDQLGEALYDLNYYFTPINLQFFILRQANGEYLIDYIDNDDYFEGVDDASEANDLRQENPVPDVINTWFTPEYYACGSSTYSTFMVQGIVMNNVCLGATSHSTWAHEVGHFFDLYHTHETSYGIECPDGSNCSVAGDLLCDTEADPNLYGLTTSNCLYVGSTAPPPGCSGSYDPPIENLMSYATKNCRTIFTSEQISKIMNTMLYGRAYLFQYNMTDSDGDGVPDLADNCRTVANADQANEDYDSFGDVCDNCLGDWINDADHDGLCTADDPCPNDPANDADGDGFCADNDVCPTLYNPGQEDADGDGVGDQCDPCVLDPFNDIDHDGLCANVDNCSENYNPTQLDTDEDGIGNECDLCPNDPENDIDQDGFCAGEDNCPATYNPDQADSNRDGIGDLCCCGAATAGLTGNTDCTPEGNRNLADITRLIDYVYISKEPLCCRDNGNVDGDTLGNINLADITQLIDHIYISKAETASCL